MSRDPGGEGWRDQPAPEPVDPADGFTLTSAEAAAYLGVKQSTVYAYVSRGLLARRVAEDGRTSRFDRRHLDALRGGAGDDGGLRTVLATGITAITDDALYYRGVSVTGAVAAGMGFEQVTELLWQQGLDGRIVAGDGPSRPAAEGPAPAGVDRLRLAVASASSDDELRHDLSPVSVSRAGAAILSAMLGSLGPTVGDDLDATVAELLWPRLSPQSATPEQIRCLDAALVLLADHGLAGSTMAARVAASLRADPYSVVSAALGAVGGRLHGGAPADVHGLLTLCDRRGLAAVGDWQRTTGSVPGFGHRVYRGEDPRFACLMARLRAAWPDDRRFNLVDTLVEQTVQRSGLYPNVDLAVGLLAALGAMQPEAGKVIFALARTPGWLAHAMEEYEETPLRFRAKARYIGPRLGRAWPRPA